MAEKRFHFFRFLHSWPWPSTFQGQNCTGALQGLLWNVFIFTWSESDYFEGRIDEQNHIWTGPHVSCT